MRKIWKDIMALRHASKFFDQEWPKLKKLLIQTLLLILACEIIMIVQYWPVQGITEIIVQTVAQQQPLNISQFIYLTAFLLVSLVLGAFVHTKMDNVRNDFFCGEFATMHAAAMDKMLNLPTSWHVEHSTGEKDSKVKENIDRLEYIVGFLGYGALPVIMRIVITAFALLIIGWQLLVYGLICFALYLVLARINLPTMKRLSKSWYNQREEISEHSKSLTSNWYALRSFGREHEYVQKHCDSYNQYWSDDRDRHRPWRNRLTTHEVLVATLTVVFYWLLVGQTQYGVGITVGAMVMAMFWMTRMLNNLYQLNDFFRYYYRGMQSLREMVEFFNTPSDMPQPEQPKWPQKLEGAIRFKDVSFQYPGKEKWALRNINLEVNAGEVIALVGESGGGKSTLACLIAGERPATSGVVEVDGIDIRELDLHRYRSEGLAVVPQRSSLLSSTIAENVALGKWDATDLEIENALKQAYAWDFVESLPNGIHSKVGEHGVYLSGGQQQRIAIARAFIRESSRVLVLDEATSSLDGSSQKEVQESLSRLVNQHENKTVFVIAHRLSTVKIAQRIVVMQNGEMIGEGTHDELLITCPYYRHLCDLELNNGSDNKEKKWGEDLAPAEFACSTA
ncbi:ABC transporter ATP-binding protein [bacterium]|nr:MAG: ABC transporter ATP-binding protein [bacterium]